MHREAEKKIKIQAEVHKEEEIKVEKHEY